MTQRVEEALRYLGGRKTPKPCGDSGCETAAAQVKSELCETIQQTLKRLDQQIIPRQLYRLYRVERSTHGPESAIALLDGTSHPVLSLPGQLAASMLRTCHQAAVMVCTLGTAFDSLMRTQQARGMAEAAVLNACGNVLVEDACDRVEQELAAQLPNLYLTDRFSPGYGDLPLTLQPRLLQALDAARLIGVYATESSLMIPIKTVTAIVGLSHQPQQAKIRGCAYCSFRDTCTIRKDGKHCASF